jgi:hypothetical protein
MRQFWRLKNENEGVLPALHPMLAALFIVLDSGADFSEIGRNHWFLRKHKYYNPRVKFPEDISGLSPPSGDCWWESLGEL